MSCPNCKYPISKTVSDYHTLDIYRVYLICSKCEYEYTMTYELIDISSGHDCKE